MRTWLVATSLLCGMAFNAYAAPKTAEAPTPAVDKNKASYSVGFTLGTNLAQQFSEINKSEFLSGINDALNGKSARFTQEEMSNVILSFQREVMKKRLEDRKVAADKNKAEGEAFLASKKKEPGVKTLASGLSYKVITEGKGNSPTLSDSVKVTYTGTLINGQVFDSRTDASNPMTFNLNQVIQGWREALQLMKPGATWEIYVPSSLGYGPQGTPGLIGPNAALVFKITLIGVEKAPAVPQSSSNSSLQNRSVQ